MRFLIRILCLLALTVAATPTLAAPRPAPIGQITSVAADGNGNATVTGWSCEPGNTAPIKVHLYVGGAYPAGQMMQQADASGEATAPGCAGARHGFTASVPAATLFRYAGLQVFAHGIAGDNATSALLGGSGRFALPDYSPIPASHRVCDISDLAGLASCLAHAPQFDEFALRADLVCRNAAECCPGNAALIRLDGLSKHVFNGNGHVLRRAQGAPACPAVTIKSGQEIVVRNLSLDENEQEAPCELATKSCASTILVESAHTVRLEGVHVYSGKGYVVKVWAVDGFAFANSSLSDSGIIGLYVGHYKYGHTDNLVIANSVIARSRTNAIAIQGAYAKDMASPVLLINNVLTGNHWHGLWPVGGVPGGITTGGQLLIGDGANIRVTGTIEGDGACGNCVPAGQTVGGLEIGDDNGPGAGLHGLAIDHNYMYSAAAVAVGQNPNTPVSEVSVSDNNAIGFAYFDSLKATGTARVRNNLVTADATVVRSGPALNTINRGNTGFALSPAPRLGAAMTPLFRCQRGKSELVSLSRDCDRAGQLKAVLGYSWEPSHRDARPLFACQSAAEVFPSFDPKCEGQKQLAQLGYALPKAP